MKKIKQSVLTIIMMVGFILVILISVLAILEERLPNGTDVVSEILGMPSLGGYALLLAGVIPFLLTVVSGYLLYKMKWDFKHFKIKDYEQYIKENSVEESIGDIPNKDHILRCAERIWLKKYGEKILDEKPYVLFRDFRKGAWLARGTPVGNHNEVCHILINGDDGKVLAVWRGAVIESEKQTESDIRH